MTINEEEFAEVEFSTNSDPRCPVVLVLDCSHSMTQQTVDGPPLQVLNDALDTLVEELQKDPLAKRRVEISFVIYGTSVLPASQFSTVENIELPELEPLGQTSTGQALNEALDALKRRKETYRKNGIDFFRPWIMLLTDGESTDDVSEARKRLDEEEARKGVAFFPIGIKNANMEKLAELSPRTPLKLDGLKFNELFQWLSASQAAVSASNPGDTVPLPSPNDWASI